MRLDKFLKVCRIIKRRTIASELCEHEKVLVNDDAKKPSYTIKENDNITVHYYNNIIKLIIVKIPPEHLKKEDIGEYIKII